MSSSYSSNSNYYYNGSGGQNPSAPLGSSSALEHSPHMAIPSHSHSQRSSPSPSSSVKGPPRKPNTPLSNQQSSLPSGSPLGPPLGPPQPPRSVTALQQQGQQQPPHSGGQPDYTQVSPAKLALRRHLSQERLAQASADQLHGKFLKESKGGKLNLRAHVKASEPCNYSNLMLPHMFGCLG